MNIKSMLLGTAAALIAVSGARAADAIVMVEPEPVDYVRVCDVYGTGFFYIPGTETCLKIGGYVRMRLQARDEAFNIDPDGDFDDDYVFNTRTRARLDFDAREETELGTLRAKIRLEATNNSENQGGSGDLGGAGYNATEAYMQLGGLTIGFLDSAWTHNDGGIEDGMLTDSTFSPGDFTANRISYTYAAGGFSGTVSVEDDNDGDFTPDVIGKLAYTGGFGGAYLMGVFDEDSNDFGDNFDRVVGFDGLGNPIIVTDDFITTADLDDDGSDNAFVVMAGVLLENLIAEDSAFKVNGFYAFDPSAYGNVGDVFGYLGGNNFGFDAVIASEFQIDASYSQSFGKLSAGIGGFYGETFDVEGTVLTGFDVNNDPIFDRDDLGSFEYYGGAVNVGYDITSNFSVLGEVTYRDVDAPAEFGEFEQVGGFLEFKRTF